MWSNARLLNTAAGALFALALALTLYFADHALLASSAFPLRAVDVQGELHHVRRADVVNALQGRVRGNFFSVDLEAVRSLFQSLAWVRRAEVRRVWPDRLAVRIEENVALARWGQPHDTRLVNTYGELFSGKGDASLPIFSGPAGTEGEIARRYASFRQLLAPIALEPVQVQLSSRLAWQLKLSDGLTVQLGRDSDKDRVEDRLAKFIAVYPQTVAKLGRRLDYVDLRYPNGFALRLPEQRGPESRKRKRV